MPSLSLLSSDLFLLYLIPESKPILTIPLAVRYSGFRRRKISAHHRSDSLSSSSLFSPGGTIPTVGSSTARCLSSFWFTLAAKELHLHSVSINSRRSSSIYEGTGISEFPFIHLHAPLEQRRRLDTVCKCGDVGAPLAPLLFPAEVVSFASLRTFRTPLSVFLLSLPSISRLLAGAPKNRTLLKLSVDRTSLTGRLPQSFYIGQVP